jgi:flagellar motor switch protein FliM
VSSASMVETRFGKPGKTDASQRQPMIHPCNFRYAGRLSNENARTLTTLHEKFAVQVANALGVYLGASLQLKLVSLEQMAIQDYIAGTSPSSYLLPCALNVLESSFLMEMDSPLVFPIIDLLLGGSGAAGDESRELTEIDEEIMQSVTAVVVKEVERAWRALNITLTLNRCIKPTMISQIFPVNEKLVLLLFEMDVAGTSGHFKIVLPTSFVGFLLRHLKAVQSKKMSSMRHFSNPSFRDRLLDSTFRVSADMTRMRVLVKDLVGLKAGSVLRMTAPVKNAGQLTVEDVDIFEAAPVRNGKLKAAQLLSRSHEPAMTKE